MGLIDESITLYKREMLIFQANLRANIVRALIFPLVIIVFFGNIGNAVSHTPISVVNYANNAQANDFINTLQSDNQFNIVALTDENSALNLLHTGAVQIVVIILPGFPDSSADQPAVQVYYSNSQPQVIAASLPVINQDAKEFGGAGIASQQSSPVPQQTAQSEEVSSNPLYSAQGNYIDFLTGGLLAMVVIFGALFSGGISYITDRQSGNIKAFLITPINKNAIVLSRIFSGSTQGLISAFLALGIGLFFGVTIAMGPSALIYIAVVVILLGVGFSGISMMLASRIKRADIFAIFAQAIGLPLWFISGGIVPISSLPGWMQPISNLDPLTYASNISRGVILQGFVPPGELVTDLCVLIIFASAMMLLAFRALKSTIE